MTESSSSNIVVEAAERLLHDLADPQALNHAKDDTWRSVLWAALENSGLPLSWVAEEFGGSGADAGEGFALLSLAGRYALPVPLAETMLAGWLLSQASISCPSGAMTVAPVDPLDRIVLDDDTTLSGQARAVPFALQANHVAILAQSAAGPHVALVKRSDCLHSSAPSLSGDDMATLTLDRVKPIALRPAPAHWTPQTLAIMGAVARSLQIGGALQWLLTQTVTYSTERIAFEKQISKFQVVQHSLARLAAETAAAVAAAASAAQALAVKPEWNDETFLEASAAKIRCSEAATASCAIAHQVHGAIGFTAEHTLHRFSLRALAWRDDFGNETYWSIALGKAVASLGPDHLWPLITSR
jgi:acyl-CoA dehydrogenase